ncbi:hypothetical protein Hanom_Chr06g00519751 [Helianthus anomalus]
MVDDSELRRTCIRSRKFTATWRWHDSFWWFRMEHGGGGYMGSGYGDANGNSGYGNSRWRADPSQASGNYGGQGNGGQGYGLRLEVIYGG